MAIIALALPHFSGQTSRRSPAWPWLAAFVGFMAFQAAFTGFCLVSKMLGKGNKSGACCGA